MAVVSKNEITLKLITGKKWHTTAGFIIAKSVNIGGKTYPLAATEGKVVIAVIACLTGKPFLNMMEYYVFSSCIIIAQGSSGILYLCAIYYNIH